MKPEVSKSGTLAHYGAKNIEIYVGDFFDLSAETLGQVDAVYDRAALVALPVEMRRLYTRHLMALTQAASQLLITLEYDQSQMAGPPFSVSGDEISAHYGDHYRPDLISSKAIDGQLAARCRRDGKCMAIASKLIACPVRALDELCLACRKNDALPVLPPR